MLLFKGFLLAAFAALCCANATAYEPLTRTAKAQYKEIASYYDICRDPGKLLKQAESKVKFKIVFKNKSDTLPAKYDELGGKTYAMVVPDGDSPESKGFSKVPILYGTTKSKLRDDITVLELDKPIIIYATLRFRMYKDPKKKDADSEKLYYMFIDDLETPEATVAKENVDSAKDSDFVPAKARKVDLQYDKFLDMKVSIDLHFMDTDNKLPNDLLKLTDMTNETHFTILPAESFHTPLVAARDNEKCIEPLLEAGVGDAMTISGVLRKAEDPTAQKKTPLYYFLVYSISLEQDKKPAPAPSPTAAADSPSSQEAQPKQ